MNRFKKVYIEITDVCNLSCSFCPKTKRKPEFLNIKRFKRILNEIKPYTKYIYFHLMGEPLLNPNLEIFLKIAYEEGFKVNITTNGTMLNEKKEILLNAKSLRQINISLHSFEANSNVNFNEYFNNVLTFINECNRNTNIITSMRLWNFDSENLRGQNNLNKDIVCKIEDVLQIKEDILTKLEEEKQVKIRDRIYLNGAEKFQWPDINIESLGDEGFCHGLRDHFGILVDGTVVPCCLDGEGNIPLGNIHKQHLSEILQDDRAVRMYEGFSCRKRVEELCKRCGYSEIFNK